ncbi:hypothetical protein [Nonomuraea sp. C10]|uniref:hypothetical protein n=1 Tax=Nonomuraea sp. C10 TaxID=2600577 RepID=UPI0011CD527C|nr:hypothetical protein [Nonomuraea sp. C10]TXK39469.1 hypothetical protein FR742_07610 [Nonomuraea sp. C10]
MQHSLYLERCTGKTQSSSSTDSSGGITESSGGIIVQVNNFGSVTNQTNIDRSISLPQADIQAGIEQLKQLIAAGSIPQTVGTEIVADVEDSLNEAGGRPTSRLKFSLLRLRDMLAAGGASADDVAKVAGAIAAVSGIIGG